MGKAKILLYLLAMAMSVVSLILNYTGQTKFYGTGPLLGLGILFLALAGILKE